MKVSIQIVIIAFLIGMIRQPLLAQTSDFSVTTTCGSGNVQFTNNSTFTNDAIWDFGNGVTLTTTTGNPLITYSNPGYYTVVLTVTSGASLSVKSMSVFVPAKLGFTYGDNICMSASVTGGVLGVYPQPSPSGLNGRYQSLTAGLNSYLDATTGYITFSSNITPFTYNIQYVYTVPGCSLSSTTSTTTIGLGYAVTGAISGPTVSWGCDRAELTIVPTAKGSLQWQVSVAGGSFQDLPNTGEVGSVVNPFNDSYKNDYLTPTITTTSVIRATLSDPVCGILYSDNTLLYTITGLSMAGTLSTPTPVICENSSPLLSLTGYLGKVTWQYSTDPLFTSSTSVAGVAQQTPLSLGTLYNTSYSPASSIFNSTVNVYFRASVTYAQYITVANCNPVYSNVITISPLFCTVTSAILNTTTSPICLSSSSTVGVMFNSSVVSLIGSVATVTSYLWNFGSGASPSTYNGSTPGIIKYLNATSSIKTVTLTVSGPGISYITTTKLQIDALSSATGITPSNLTLCGGNTALLTLSGYNTATTAGITWFQSPNQSTYTAASGTNNISVYTTPGLSSDIYYKAVVQNGACPAATTPGYSFIKVLPPLTISPNFDSPVVTLCEGLNTTITASGINGNIVFNESNAYSGPFTTVTALSGTYTGTGSFATKNFTVAGVYYYQAQISNTYSCASTVSGIYTVSVVSCPIITNITTLGISLTNEACVNNSAFSIGNITPTITGVTFTTWQWDLGLGSTKGPFTTTTGNTVNTSYTTSGIKTINLTVSGVAGIKSYFTTVSAVITIDGLSTATGIISSASVTSNNICKNNSVTITVSGTNAQANVQWQSSLNSITGWTNVSGANAIILTTATLTTTSYYQALITNGICPVYTSSGIGIAVVPDVTITPVADQVINKCSGENANLSAVINFGNIHWETSIPGSGWQLVTTTTGSGFNTTALTTNYLTTTTNYRASVTDVYNCMTVTSGIFTISVTSCPIQPVISVTSAFLSQRTCATNPVFNFADITPTISGVTYTKWEWDFGNNASPTTISGQNPGSVTFTGSDIYPVVQLTITGLSGITESTYSKSIVLTIDGLSTSTGILSSTINNNACKNSTVSLTTTGTNTLGIIQWQSSTVSSLTGWGNVIGGTNTQYSYTTDPLYPSVYYRTLVQNGVCPVYSTTGILVNVLPDVTISPTTTSTITICSGERRTLTVSGNNGNFQWQINSFGWIDISTATGASFVTDYLTTTQYYQAKISDILNCMTSISGIFTVSVTSCPIQPVISVTSAFLSQRTCATNPVFNFADITPTISGVTYTRWEWDFGNNANPTTISGQNPGAVTFTGSDIYPVVQLTITGLSGVTESTYSKSIVLTIDGLSTSTGILSSTINNNACKNSTVSLTTTGTNTLGIIQWQSSTVSSLTGWGNVIGGTNTQYSYATNSLYPTVYYRTLVQNGVCPVYSTTGILVNVLPDVTISPTTPSAITICSGERRTLTVSGLNGNFQWQTYDSGLFSWVDIPTATGTSFITDYLTSTQLYRAKISDVLGCSVSISGIFTVSVTSCPVQPVISVTSSFLSQRTCASNPVFNFADITPTISGVTYTKWEWDFGSNANPTTLSGQNPGAVTFTGSDIYPVVQLTITGLSGVTESTYSKSIVLTIDGLSTSTGILSSTINNNACKNSTVSLTTTGTNTLGIIQWQSSTVSSLTGWGNVTGGTGATTPQYSYTTDPLYPSIYYRTLIQNGVCPVYSTTGILVNVLPEVAISPTTTSTITICSGERRTLTVSGLNGNFQWQEGSFGGAIWANITTSGSGATTSAFTTDYLTTTQYYRAKISDILNCMTSISGIFTVSVTSCPVQPVISVTSSFLSQRTCASNPVFNFADITPTISGVTFTDWAWDFGMNALPATSTQQNPGAVTYLGSDIYPVVQLTITGLSGITVSTYVKSIVLTVDGLSTATGILSTAVNHNACKNVPVSFTVTGTNALGVFQWQSSIVSSLTGWGNVTGGTGATTTHYITNSLTDTVYYRALIKNGVCPVYSTSGISVNILPDVDISPASNTTITICSGERRTLTVSGNNGNFQWQYSPNNGTNWFSVSSGSGSTTLAYTTDYLTVNQLYRATISDILNCMTSVSGTFTVSVTSCPVQPVISVTSAFLSQRTCASNPVFNFADITPTISGVTYTKWEWDFGSNANPTTFSGQNPGAVVYIGSDIYPVVQLTITGLSGVTESTYSKSIVLTIDGISTSTGILSSTINNNACKNSTVSLTTTGTNTLGVIQWQSSIVGSLTGWGNVSGGNGATTIHYNTDPLTDTIYYRVLIKNGVCPVYSTDGIAVDILPDVDITPTTITSIKLCNGENTTLIVNGNNGNIQWQYTPNNGINWLPVATGSGSTTNIYTTDYLYNTTNKYRASISNILNCTTSVSGVFIVSVTSCPIQPVISVTSPLLSQRTCYSQPDFTFMNITPTITGVTFIKWAWEFDSPLASLPSLSTTTGSGTINVNYFELDPYFISTIKKVQLTITGFSGNNTFTGISFVNITIDGIPTVPGFRSTDASVCSDDPDGTFLNLNIADINPTPLNSSKFKWYVSTSPGLPYIRFIPSSYSLPYPTGQLLTTTSYIITAENGVCDVFTTPSVVINVLEKSKITGFSYPSQLCNDQTSTVIPLLNRTGNAPGTYFVSSSNSNEFTIDHNNGSFVPDHIVLSGNSENYSITYSIPGVGGCTSVSTVTSVEIGKKQDTPIFSYSSSYYCSDQKFASKAVNTGEGKVPGSYYFSTNIEVNSITGIVTLENITLSGVYSVIFQIPTVSGCSAISKTATLTITSAPTLPDFTYANNQYCSDIGVISVSSAINTDDALGYWSITPSANINISSVTGTISLTGATLTDYYFITYIKPPRGGCYTSVQRQKAVFVTQLPATPYFDYGGVLPKFCSNAQNIVVLSFSGSSIGLYSTEEPDIYVNANTGKITVPLSSVSGIKTIEYIIKPSGACDGHTVIATAQVNFSPVPAPSFNYEKLYNCNNATVELHPMGFFDLTPGSGSFFYTNGSNKALKVNTLTGVVTITPSTQQDFYNIYFKTPLISTCGVGDIISKDPVTIFVEQLPPTPFFSYGNDPICSNNPRKPTVTGLSSAVFSVANDFSINPNDGTLYPSNQQDGIYIVTCTNRSVVSINNILTTTCPLVSNTAVVTVGSNIAIPPFDYGKDKFCSDEGVKNLSATLTGGYFYSNAGLTLNTLTGAINIATSGRSGSITSYQVSYRIDRNNGCSSIISSTGISIYTKQTQPYITYPRPEYCQTDSDPSPAFTSVFVGGFFYGPSNISVNSISGVINLAASSPRQNIDIGYVVPANEGCPTLSTTTSVSITAPETPVLSYGNAVICNTNSTQPVPYYVQPSNGTFTGSFGLKINQLSGKVTLAGSPVGVSQITYLAPDKGACKGTTVTDNITITSPINTPYFKYIGSPFCHSGSVLPIGSFQYGSFRASTNIQFITSISGLTFKDTVAGEIDLKNSIPGEKYYISYVVPPIGGCEPIIVQDTISIRTAKVGLIKSEAEKGLICGGNDVLINLSGEFYGTLTWRKKEQTDSLWSISNGTFSNNAFTTEKLNDTTYFQVKADYNNCPDSSYSNIIKIRVIPASFGGTATTDDNTNYKLICNEFTTLLSAKDYRGKIVWQFSDDSTFYEDVDALIDTLPTFHTKSQNQYGNKRWFRTRVTNSTCPSDYSNSVLVKVCDNVLFVPNALTPGSGNQNSYWDLTKLNLRDDAEVKVFNRYGSIVYSAKGSQLRVLENCWDGGGLPTGTYYYTIDKKDQSQPLAGSVSIVK